MAQKDLMHLARNPKTAKTICTCFRQYDSWGIELDCIKVFSGNWEAISQKLLVIRQSIKIHCISLIAQNLASRVDSSDRVWPARQLQDLGRLQYLDCTAV